MAEIEWKQSYSVGIPAIDHEHEELIGLVNRLNAVLADDPDADEVSSAFGDLLRAISSHFALEERFMREHRYDQFADHKADHEKLLDELRDFMDDYGATEDEAAAAAELSSNVERWFTNHFATHDARLHKRLGDHHHH